MRWCIVVCGSLAACQHNGGAGERCSPGCGDGLVCRYDMCVPEPAACGANTACPGDQYCDPTAKECLPWGVGPGGTGDPSCAGAAAPGVFFPGVQCQWLGPPAGDPFPYHVNVLSSPLVATLDDPTAPSIVFTAYNGYDQFRSDACSGDNPEHYGLIRILDGRTCQERATLGPTDINGIPPLVASTQLAIGDIGGDDATPEIVAATAEGGVVAFTHRAKGWDVLWKVPTAIHHLCDWAGPVIHDLDDDGLPEVIFWGVVYNGQTGATIDDSLSNEFNTMGIGNIPVIADIDGDGVPEFVGGSALYSWDKQHRRWGPKRPVGVGSGLVAVGDFGTYPAIGQDDRAHLDGIAEVAVVSNGVLYVLNAAGRLGFMAHIREGGITTPQGGPPVIADFDGDGRAEIGVAGAYAYQVFDPDCALTPAGLPPDPATCASLRTDGILWESPVQNRHGSLGSSSAFDFEGDGRLEAVYSDECFTRIYDGTTGKVLASHQRTTCSWFDGPVVADSDGDGKAELITPSSTNCNYPCPAVDPVFDGVMCLDDGDCPSTTHCGREQRDDALGRCRCTQDADCGDGYVCRDPIAGLSLAGKVCRTPHAAKPSSGVTVLADTTDRWVSARPIWNQNTYSVTNIDPAGKVPRTSQWLHNWTQPGLNNFRANVPVNPAAPRAEPDLTIKQAKIRCDAAGPIVSAEVCNRGSREVAGNLPVAVYASTTPSKLRCQAQTAAPLPPGACTTVSCIWQGPDGDGVVVADDRGDGSGTVHECHEDNNLLSIHVSCP